MSDSGPRVDAFQILVGYSMLVLFEGALVWNLYAEWLPDPARAKNPSCEKHLQFAMHSLLSMLLTGGVLTYLFSDLDWQDVASTRQYGYNDITVVLDHPPSIYVMPAYWFVTGTGFLLYVLEDTKRLLHQTDEQPHPGVLVSHVVNGALAVSVMLFSLTLEIRAHQDMVAHAVPALLLVFVLPLPFIMQTFEVFWKRSETHRPERSYGLLIIVVSWFTITSMLKVGLSLFAASVRPVSPALAKPLDGAWVLLAFVLPFLLHPAPAGSYQQLGGGDAGASAQRPGTPAGGGASCARCLAAALVAIALLAVAGLACAAFAKSPGLPAQEVALRTPRSSLKAPRMEEAGPSSSSAVGYETVQHSRLCAKRGEQCRCPGGFVLFGRGVSRSSFSSGSSLARWDVYPARVKDALLCDEATLGDPFIFSKSEECRCVESGLVCEQTSEATGVGCGVGSAAELLDLDPGAEELTCCKSHDMCYGLCGHAKQQCDEDFDKCLDSVCILDPGRATCRETVQRMKQAVRTEASQAAFSSAERSREHWVPTDQSVALPGSLRNDAKDSRAKALAASFDCLSGEQFWQVEWSDGKKDWCCQHEGRGCTELDASSSVTLPLPAGRAPHVLSAPAGVAAAAPEQRTARSHSEAMRETSSPPTAPAPSEVLVAQATTTRVPQSSPHKPYNCLTTDTWPADKTEWCCANVGLGCDDTARRMSAGRVRPGLALRSSIARGASKHSNGTLRETEPSAAKHRAAC